MVIEYPELRGFNFVGGFHIAREFMALALGLVLYTATYIAEIVRSGILAVAHGQTEASRALGLHNGLVLRLVVIPQALRVIIPPLTSQYLRNKRRPPPTSRRARRARPAARARPPPPQPGPGAGAAAGGRGAGGRRAGAGARARARAGGRGRARAQAGGGGAARATKKKKKKKEKKKKKKKKSETTQWPAGQ